MKANRTLNEMKKYYFSRIITFPRYCPLKENYSFEICSKCKVPVKRRLYIVWDKIVDDVYGMYLNKHCLQDYDKVILKDFDGSYLVDVNNRKIYNWNNLIKNN